MCQYLIVNIDINKDYDESLGIEEVYYQLFFCMVVFFGCDMQVYCYDCYFQMYYFDIGQIELQFDDYCYLVQVLLFVIMLFLVLYVFIIEFDSDGYVLMVYEELIWLLLEVFYFGMWEIFGLLGICLLLVDKFDELVVLVYYWQLICWEFIVQLLGWEYILVLLVQVVFILLLCNVRFDDYVVSGMCGELKLFQCFNQMIDSYYYQYWMVLDYVRELYLIELWLIDICCCFVNCLLKWLIFDCQLCEVKCLLLFFDSVVNEIVWQLGFKDFVYFVCFFSCQVGCLFSSYWV